MMYKIVKEKFLLIKLVLLIFLSFILIFYGKVVASGALKGLYLCGQVLIPSLFPFMVLSTFVVKSGLSDVVSKYCGKFSVLFFGVSKQCTATILLSLIGGFPVGAKGISALYESKKISDVEAEKLSYSLVCAGPGFLLIFVGTTLLNSIDAGICLYASQILSVFIMGIICKISFKKQIFNSVTELNTNENTSDALINSVRSATYSIIEMCGIVVIFSAVISLAEKLFSISYLYTYLATFLEITTASKILCESKNIILLAFAVGFGGLSVHFQIFQALRNIPVKKHIFMAFRVIQGIITAVLSYLFIKLFNISIPVYSSIREVDFSLSTSVMGSILLLLTGLCFLASLKNYKNGG